MSEVTEVNQKTLKMDGLRSCIRAQDLLITKQECQRLNLDTWYYLRIIFKWRMEIIAQLETLMYTPAVVLV